MGGVRNGKNAGTPEHAAVRQEALQPGASGGKAAVDTSEVVDGHIRAAARLLREGSAARAFGELARASRGLSMTPRLAAGIVRMALLAGTEAAAIITLEAAPTAAFSRRAVHRQLARVLRRVEQVPRAIAALEALLLEWPDDRRAQRVLQVLRARASGGGGVVPEEGATSTQGVLAKLPVRKDGAPDAASWEYDDRVYLIETVIGPPLTVATPAGGQGASPTGAATRAEASVVVEGGGAQGGSRTSATELPSVVIAVEAAPVGAPRKSATELPEVETPLVGSEPKVSGPRTSAAELSAAGLPPVASESRASGPRKSATEFPVVETPPVGSESKVSGPRKSATEFPVVETPPVVAEPEVRGPRKSATEIPVVETLPVVAEPQVSGPRKSATEWPSVGASPAPAVSRPGGSRKSVTELPAAELSSSASDAPTNPARKSVTELPAAELASGDTSEATRQSATESSVVATPSGDSVAHASGSNVSATETPSERKPPVAAGSRSMAVPPGGAAPELEGVEAQVPATGVASPSTSLESHKTVLELPAINIPVAQAPRTLVELPAISVPPRALDFEARKTEVEMPALGADVLVPRTEPAREFAFKSEALSVPWTDSPDDDGPTALRSSQPAATWHDASASDEVTSEAQPFHLADAPPPVPPRASAPAKAERRKTPVASEALPAAVASKVDPAVDSRSGTMEVSLAELEAALSGGPATASSVAAPAEPRSSTHEDDNDEVTRSQKVEAQLIARRAWAELAQLYLKRADQAKDASRRAEALTRLAEVMENELHDPRVPRGCTGKSST